MKEKFKELLSSKILVFVLLIATIFSEYLLIHKLKLSLEYANLLFVTLPAIVLSVTGIGLYLKVYELKSISVKKLITNAIGFSVLSLVFLVLFIAHLTWFVDTCYKMVIDGDFLINLSKILTIFCATFIVIIVFPKPKKKQESTSDSYKVLYTGMSLESSGISEANIDLLLKPIEGKYGYKNISKIVIFPSLIFENFSHYIKEETVNKIKNRIKELKGDNTIILKFTDCIDYDKFDESVKVIKQAFEDFEIKTRESLIHVSPGTKVPTIALSILGIKGDRRVVYTDQKTKDITIIDVDILSLEDLLSELWKEMEEK